MKVIAIIFAQMKRNETKKKCEEGKKNRKRKSNKKTQFNWHLTSVELIYLHTNEKHTQNKLKTY